MRKKIKEKELLELLKEVKLDTPREGFSDELSTEIIENYAHKRVKENPIEKYLGRFVLLFLVGNSLWMLYDLGTLSIDVTAILSASAFIMGLWIAIGFLKRSGNSILTGMTTSFHKE